MTVENCPICSTRHNGKSSQDGNARPLPVVDMHCHIALPSVEKLAAGQPGREAEIAATATLQGPEATEYNRTIMLPQCMLKMTDITQRLADMDAMGVDVQVLSPSPGQYHYWADHDLASTIVSMQNAHIAETVARHPDRLVGLGTVALQHPALAVQQLQHGVRHLGMRGVEISTSAGGRELAHPALEGFWAKAAELGAIVFIHPLGTSLGARLDRHYLANTIGQPIETTIALSHLIFGGVLDRQPSLKIVAAHGGGYLPTYVGRSDHAWRTRPDARSTPYTPSAYLKQIYFDNLVYTPDAVRALIDQVGIGQLVVGTDYPFDMGAYEVIELARSVPGLTEAEREALLGGNAMRLLGLDARDYCNMRLAAATRSLGPESPQDASDSPGASSA